MKAQEMLGSRWITGPAFLWDKENQWPTRNGDDHNLQESDPKVKSVAMATATEETKTAQADSKKLTLQEGIEYFSDWYRAKRAVALC